MAIRDFEIDTSELKLMIKQLNEFGNKDLQNAIPKSSCS